MKLITINRIEDEVFYDKLAEIELNIEAKEILCLKIILKCVFKEENTVSIPIYLYGIDVWNFPRPFLIKIPELNYLHKLEIILSDIEYNDFLSNIYEWIEDKNNDIKEEWEEAVNYYVCYQGY